MAFPDTREAQAHRILERIRCGAQELDTLEDEADNADDEERAGFFRGSAAGAAAYAEVLERARPSDAELRRAELVARAAELGGWISAGTIDDIPAERAAMDELVAQGFFASYPAVPGRWVSCYRLVVPA